MPAARSYQSLLGPLEKEFGGAQAKAAVVMNRDWILHCQGIGRETLPRQSAGGWGTHVIERFARDLRAAVPEQRCLSLRNLKYARSFAEAWPERLIVRQLAPLGHRPKAPSAGRLAQPRHHPVPFQEAADRRILATRYNQADERL